jgi:tRNA pseudouridine38-40 synthase
LVNRKEWEVEGLNLTGNSIFAPVNIKMKRYFLELAYKGTRYHGWQIQKNATSIQELLEKAISLVLRTPTATMGSGRTDTGVHASQQFLHFDTVEELDPKDFLKKINSILPKDVAVYSLRRVRSNGHTRFDAEWRSYVYKISLRKNPFEQDTSWLYISDLDFKKMNEAAKMLLSYEDFQCFSKIKTDVNHFRCILKEAYWEQNDHQLVFHITSNRFLRGMVRSIVGTLIEVGTGKWSLADFKKILENKDRNQAGFSAPPHGLFLCKVTYPEKIFI